MSDDQTGRQHAPGAATRTPEADLKKFLDFMARNKLNVTAQRRRIAEAFFSFPGHHTLEDFYQHVQTLDSSIGQTTVYRTLKLLCAAGLASEIHFTDSVAHYEILDAGSHHDHLMCVNCGRIVEVYDSSVEKMQKAIAQAYDFTLLGHYHVLYGLCPECRAAQKDGVAVTESQKLLMQAK